jgi:hypothetical protein
MGLNPQNYVRKPNRVEVVEITKDNIVEVATWCGGRINHIRNVMSSDLIPDTIGVPSLYGAISADIGSFVARELETGRFSVMTKDHLEQEYQQVGMRHDGIRGTSGFPRLGGN